MKRVFTSESLQELKQMIDSINAEEQGAVADWFGDRFLAIKHFFGMIGFYDPMEDIQKYHREMLDRKNVAYEQLRAVYEAISALDSRYAAGAGVTYREVLGSLHAYREHAEGLAQYGVSVTRSFESGTPLQDCFTADKVKQILDGSGKSLDDSLNKTYFSVDELKDISNEEKDEVIRAFEEENPETARWMEEALNVQNMTDDERRDIRFLLYSAPEPYRSIYIEHLKQYDYVVGEDGTYYSPKLDQIFLLKDGESFEKDYHGAYNSVFHESGHAIDCYEDTDPKTMMFEYQGQSLHDLVVSDTRNYVNQYIDANMPELTTEQREQLLRSLNLTDDAGFQYGGDSSGLDKKMEAYRNKLIRDMRKHLDGTANQSPSDVFGGVTNNAVVSNFGHAPNEEKGEKPEDYDYWYDPQSHEASGLQEMELWAEFYAAQMTHDYEQLEAIRLHFPQAYEAMEAMAREMAAN